MAPEYIILIAISIAIGAALVAALVVFAFLAIVLKRLVRPSKRGEAELIANEKENKVFSDEWLKIPYKEWTRTSRYGYNVTGYMYDFGFGRIMVCLHGHNSSHISQLKYMDMFRAMGYDVFIPDHRRSGKSGGDTITFGAKESGDVEDWIQVLREKYPGREISLFGESMGAATAILVASKTSGLGSLIEYCGYANFEGLLTRYFKSEGMRKAAARLIKPVAKHIYGFDPDDCDALKAIKKVDCPVLIMHSKADRTVTYQNALMLKTGKPDAAFLSFENSRHACSLKYYPEEFTAAVRDFSALAEEEKR